MEISAERETILLLGEIRDALKNMTDEVAGLNFRLIPSNEDRRERIANGTMSNYSSGRHKVPEHVADVVTRMLAGEEIELKERSRRRSKYSPPDGSPPEEGRRAQEVRVINTVELGPLSLGLLRALIDAIHALPMPAGTIRIKPEIAEAARGGDRYRAQATERAGGIDYGF